LSYASITTYSIMFSIALKPIVHKNQWPVP